MIKVWIQLSLLAVVVAGCVSRPEYQVFVPGVRSSQQLNSKEDIEQAMEWRWRMESIEFFCRNEQPVKRMRGVQGAKPLESDWTGTIHKGNNSFESITYLVRVDDGQPTSFMLWASDGKRSWLLEGGPIDILREHRFLGYAR